MLTVLYVTASARTTRSLSRGLGDRFIAAVRAACPDATVTERNVGRTPPPPITEAWIAAAFTPEPARTEEQRRDLALSDRLIDEVAAADLIVIATPMYNYGMPSALKAWVDQVVRVNRTFTFDLGRGDFPLAPVLRDKTAVLLTAAGEFGFGSGGLRDGMDHLVPHVRTVSRYLGVSTLHHIGIEYQEFGDERHTASVEAAWADVDRLAADLASRHAPGATAGAATAAWDASRSSGPALGLPCRG